MHGCFFFSCSGVYNRRQSEREEFFLFYFYINSNPGFAALSARGGGGV